MIFLHNEGFMTLQKCLDGIQYQINNKCLSLWMQAPI